MHTSEVSIIHSKFINNTVTVKDPQTVTTLRYFESSSLVTLS